MSTDIKDEKLFNEVVSTYNELGSIKETADKLQLSRSKVRKILITTGDLTSEITDRALQYINSGKNQVETADILGISTATLSTYLPYGNRVYNRDQKSDTALRVEACRARQARAASNQVNTVKKEVPAVEHKMYTQKEDYSGEGKHVYKLHLELDINDADFNVLKKYGKVNSGITRDVLVPGSMTLYSLHYLIQRAFGWENSHLHKFSYEQKVLDKYIGNKFGKWAPMCGLYFRFPYDMNYDIQDIYWNDDYEEGESIKSWLRRKYTGPYSYRGMLEHYLIAQSKARNFMIENPTIELGYSFEDYKKGKTGTREFNTVEAPVDALGLYFESGLTELLERLTVEQVIGLKSDESAVFEFIENEDNLFDEKYDKLKGDNSSKDMWLLRDDPKVQPLSDTLVYSYDYGDGWTVIIKCEEIYDCFNYWNRRDKNGYISVQIDRKKVIEGTDVYDSEGNSVLGELSEKVAETATLEKPIGISIDGLNVMDDVGGIYGYVEFLKCIHGEESFGSFEDKDDAKDWGRMMGWTGRQNNPDRII